MKGKPQTNYSSISQNPLKEINNIFSCLITIIIKEEHFPVVLMQQNNHLYDNDDDGDKRRFPCCLSSNITIIFNDDDDEPLRPRSCGKGLGVGLWEVTSSSINGEKRKENTNQHDNDGNKRRILPSCVNSIEPSSSYEKK